MKRSLGLVTICCCFFSGLIIGVVQAQEKPVAEGEGNKNVSDIWTEATTPTEVLPAVQVPSFSPLIERVSHSVVNISVEGRTAPEEAIAALPKGIPPELLPFFEDGAEVSRKPFRSLGSGFVIHSSGYIITNFHVIDSADKIYVTFQDDKERYLAKVVGADRKSDLALIRIVDTKGKTFSPVVIGDSDQVKPGDWAIAIGNPFRLDHTATVGIISAKSRKLTGGGVYDDFLQTDAAINQGNSGGPLFDAQGRVVGVNSTIYSGAGMGGGGNIGIGFAIPINLAKKIATELFEKGYVTRAWLGVIIQPVSEQIAKAMKLESTDGALIADMDPDGPAAKTDLKRGDIILSFDGKPVTSSEELPALVANTPVGKQVELIVSRKGEQVTIIATVERMQEDGAPSATVAEEEDLIDGIGLSVQNLSPEIARAIGVGEDLQGVVVAGVEDSSYSEEAGFRKGDVIVEVDSQRIKTIADLAAVLSKVQTGEPLLVLIQRGKGSQFLTLEPK